MHSRLFNLLILSKVARVIWFILAVGLSAGGQASPCAVEAPAAPMTVHECGAAVLKYLKDNRSILAIESGSAWVAVVDWDHSFSQAYNQIRERGGSYSKSDSEKIVGWLEEYVNPVQVAQDEAFEYAIKKWFGRLSGVIDFLSSAPVAGLKVFFTPSETASDLDELYYLNRNIHEELSKIVLPAYNDKQWKQSMASQLERISSEYNKGKSSTQIRQP